MVKQKLKTGITALGRRARAFITISPRRGHLLFAQAVANSKELRRLLGEHGVFVKGRIDVNRLEHLIRTDREFASNLYRQVANSVTDTRLKSLIASGKVDVVHVGRRIVKGYIAAENKTTVLTNLTTIKALGKNIDRLNSLGEHLVRRFGMAPSLIIDKYFRDEKFRAKVDSEIKNFLSLSPRMEALSKVDSRVLTFTSLRVTQVYGSLKTKLWHGAKGALKEAGKMLAEGTGYAVATLGVTGAFTLIGTMMQGPFARFSTEFLYMFQHVQVMLSGLRDRMDEAFRLASRQVESA